MKWLCLGCVLLVWIPACAGSETEAPRPAASQPKAETRFVSDLSEQSPQQIDDSFIKSDTLSYHGYDVIRLRKEVKDERPPDRPEARSDWIEVSYAVLRRNGRTLAKFDGVYFGSGNSTEFGLFPFLGGKAKQLVVSQTIPRTGRHWVVDLSSVPRIIFDSKDYGVGREEFSVIDLDHDGVYEISLPVTDFYGFGDVIPTGSTPLPEVIFKYDVPARKYLPANRMFQAYLLRRIEQDKAALAPDNQFIYRARVMDIVLQYIFAGREEEGWAFYDHRYQAPDKDALKNRIKGVLEKQPVYRYLYRVDTSS